MTSTLTRGLAPRVFRIDLRCALLTALFLFTLCGQSYSTPPPDPRKPLQVYFADVEGGQATLFVTPSGESLLIDTGWPGNGGRDADRIVAAAKNAGLSKIDYVLITHFHTDHVGGSQQLADRIPIGTFVDHGDNRETADASTMQSWLSYQALLASKKFKRISPKPGDVLPVHDVEFKVVSSDGALLANALRGAGQANSSCGASEKHPADQTENPRSLGVVVTFGQLKLLDLGDLTWDKEMELMCPINKLGKIDVYVVSHHGWFQSGSPALVYGIDPRVAIMNNGAKKGGSPSAWDIVRASPHLEDFWQLHFSEEGGTAHNASPRFIANLTGPDAANYLKLTAWPDGSFEIANSRTGEIKRYAPRK